VGPLPRLYRTRTYIFRPADTSSILSVFLSVCLSVSLSVCLSVCLSFRVSFCLSFCKSILRSFCLSVCLSVLALRQDRVPLANNRFREEWEAEALLTKASEDLAPARTINGLMRKRKIGFAMSMVRDEVFTCIHVSVRMCVYVLVGVFVCLCVFGCMHSCLCVCIYVCVC
jgi:hypothetical protein